MTINPTKSDIGKLVVMSGDGRFVDLPGTLMGFDGELLRVLFFGNYRETPTRRERLEWGKREANGNVVVSSGERK